MKKEKRFNMRERRKELGLTLEQVAAKSGVTASAIRQIEVGSFKGSFLTLHKIADVLQVPGRLLMTPEQLEIIEKFLERDHQVQMSTARKRRKEKT